MMYGKDSTKESAPKSKIGLAIGFGSKPSKAPKKSHEDAEEEEDESGKKAEVMAMKQFMAADSAEAKTKAMKAFLESCNY